MSIGKGNLKAMVEAAGVEPITILTARKLLILGTSRTAKKAPLPAPLYVYCTKMLLAPESSRYHMATHSYFLARRDLAVVRRMLRSQVRG